MRTRNLILIASLMLAPILAKANPITVQVKGMVCAFCAQGIEKKFKAMPEVSKVNVSLETKKVALETKEGKDVSDEKITKVINDAGYDVLKIERAK